MAFSGQNVFEPSIASIAEPNDKPMVMSADPEDMQHCEVGDMI